MVDARINPSIVFLQMLCIFHDFFFFCYFNLVTMTTTFVSMVNIFIDLPTMNKIVDTSQVNLIRFTICKISRWRPFVLRLINQTRFSLAIYEQKNELQSHWRQRCHQCIFTHRSCDVAKRRNCCLISLRCEFGDWWILFGETEHRPSLFI